MSSIGQARNRLEARLILGPTVKRGPNVLIEAKGNVELILPTLKLWGFRKWSEGWTYMGRKIPDKMLKEMTLLANDEVWFSVLK